MPTIPTDGLLFDVDGTLWNTVGPIAVSWNRAIRDEGLDFVITPEILQREFGKTMAEIGEKMQLKRERVRQVRDTALRKLHRAARQGRT